MRRTACLPALACLWLLLWAAPLPAARIGNLSVNANGTRAVISYDVAAASGQVYVTLILTARGRTYGPDELHLTGDLGLVRPGPEKRIVWDVLADMPEGFSGPLAGEATAVEADVEPLTGLVFAQVESGCFEMGCGPWSSECEADELPPHRVCLEPFAMAVAETPLAAYAMYLNEANATAGPQVAHLARKGKAYAPEKGFEGAPVTGVSREEAEAFARWLTAATGRVYRLPREAEWEYACRDQGRYQAYGTATGELRGRTLEASPPNLLGLSAMSGGLWEWTADEYAPYPVSHGAVQGDGDTGVLRGGRDGTELANGRCTNRYARSIEARDATTGFRLVREEQ